MVVDAEKKHFTPVKKGDKVAVKGSKRGGNKSKGGKGDIRPFTFVDVCCGIGAFHVALKRLGGTCVLACERSPTSCEVYAANHGGDYAWHDDIYTLNELPTHDVFCAGFPCTTFSLAGYRKGTDDQDAGRIIFKILDLLKTSPQRPSVVILENVPGLISIHNGETLRFIESALQDMGYTTETRVFDASDFGAPMHRKRLIIAATLIDISSSSPKLKKKSCVQDFMQKEESVDASLVLHGERYVMLPENKVYEHDGKVFVGYLTTIKYHTEDLSKLSSHAQALKIYDSKGMSENFTSTNKYAFKADTESCWLVRYLSLREMYMCMGFPKNFKIFPKSRTVALKQITNSINLHMLKPVCEWIVSSTLFL